MGRGIGFPRRNCDANMARVKGRISLRGAVISYDLLDDGRQVICEDMRHHVQDVCYILNLLVRCKLERLNLVWLLDSS